MDGLLFYRYLISDAINILTTKIYVRHMCDENIFILMHTDDVFMMPVGLNLFYLLKFNTASLDAHRYAKRWGWIVIKCVCACSMWLGESGSF